MSTLEANRYTVDVIDDATWNPALLNDYDAVVAIIGVNATMFSDYLDNGGAVLPLGGWGSSPPSSNDFLALYNMSFGDTIYPGSCPQLIALQLTCLTG